MKTQIKTLFTTLFLSLGACLLLVQFTGCGGKKSDPTPTAQDVVKAKLTAKNWMIQTVAVDGVDKTSVYAGLTIKFTETGYTTTHGEAVWPASGNWTFTNPEGTTIKRNDGIEVGVEVTDSILKLKLTWATTTLGGGRTSSVQGQNVFTFVP